MKKVALLSRVHWGMEALKTMLSFRPPLEICGVITLPDEITKLHSNHISFDYICKENNIPLFKIININNESKLIKNLDIDYLFVFGWSQLLKKEILKIPKSGCFGSHPARLPKDRGRAPVTWQIIRGYRKSAFTFFFIDEGPDSGDIIMQHPIQLTLEDSAGTFYEKMIKTGKEMLKEMVPLLLEDRLPCVPQDHNLATYLPKRKPEDGIIDWSKCSFELYNWVRGLTKPFPGAFTFFNKKKFYIWSSKIENYMNSDEPHGLVKDVDEEGLIVSTGKGALLLTSVQFDGEEQVNDFFPEKLGFLKRTLLG